MAVHGNMLSVNGKPRDTRPWCLPRLIMNQWMKHGAWENTDYGRRKRRMSKCQSLSPPPSPCPMNGSLSRAVHSRFPAQTRVALRDLTTRTMRLGPSCWQYKILILAINMFRFDYYVITGLRQIRVRFNHYWRTRLCVKLLNTHESV